METPLIDFKTAVLAISALTANTVWAVNLPPDCTNAVPSIDTLSPPTHKYSAVELLGITDPDGDPLTVTINAIFQDEVVAGPGNFSPDASGVGTSAAFVRAEREGGGNGRVYHINFTAEDGNGGICSGEVLVSVPSSPSEPVAVDDGALYDSTQ